MAIGDAYKLVLSASQLGSIVQNTYAFRMKTVGTPPLALVSALAEDIKEALRFHQHIALTYRTWKWYQVFGVGVDYSDTECARVGGLVYEQPFSGPTAGQVVAGHPLPPQCTMVVTLYSTTIGRRHRGRLYLPGWYEESQNGGAWEPAVVTNMTTGFNGLVAEYGDTGTSPEFEWGVWSERIAFGCERRATAPFDHYHVDPPHPELAFTPINRTTVRSTVHTQRRRVSGVGV